MNLLFMIKKEDKNMRETEEYLTLKWGTLKSWSFGDWATPLFKEYSNIGSCVSVMCQKDTPRQKEIICELIDGGKFKKVFLDWDGKYVTKKQAKKYVMEYDSELL